MLGTQEFFEALQSHQFNCYTFMALARNRRSLVSKVLRVLTDSELEKLTNSFENEIDMLQQKKPNKLFDRFYRAYQVFLDEKTKMNIERKNSPRSCLSEVGSSMFKKLPLSAVILLFIYKCIPSWFKMAAGLIAIVFLMDALDIYLKWEEKVHPRTFESRLQKEGHWPRIKDVVKRIKSNLFSRPPQTEHNPSMREEIQNRGRFALCPHFLQRIFRRPRSIVPQAIQLYELTIRLNN